MRQAGLLLIASLLTALQAVAQPGPTRRVRVWASAGAGVTSSGDLLGQAGLWVSPGQIALGVRRGIVKEPIWTEHEYQETSFLAGFRPRMAGSLLVIAAGIARTSGWRSSSDGCFLDCSPWERHPVEPGFGPAFALDVARTYKSMGLGVTLSAVGGATRYVAAAISVHFGLLP